jgi:hypothetical protein
MADKYEKGSFEEIMDQIAEDDPLGQLSQFRNLIELIIDLAEEIAGRTATKYDDKIIAILRNLIDRLMGPVLD